MSSPTCVLLRAYSLSGIAGQTLFSKCSCWLGVSFCVTFFKLYVQVHEQMAIIEDATRSQNITGSQWDVMRTRLNSWFDRELMLRDLSPVKAVRF